MRGFSISGLLRDETGGATVEFVAVIGPFVLLTFFILEILIALHWIGTTEKAVQLGARLAVVSTPVVTTTGTCPAGTGLPTLNCLATGTGHVYGQPCPANCAGYSALTCAGGTGGACNATNFSAIVTRMTSITTSLLSQGCPLAQPGCHVTITYADSQLGFAGGPTIPSVTVTVSGVPYGLVLTTILANFRTRVSSVNCLLGGCPELNSFLTNLPDITVTLTGEDLNSAGG